MTKSPEPAPAEKVLLTVEEAAQLMSIGKTKVYELINRRVIKAISLGPRCTRVPRVALEEWAKQQAEVGEASGASVEPGPQ